MRATPRSSSTACHAAPLPRGGVHGRKAPKCVGAAPQRVAPSHTALDPGEAVARAHGIERSAHWPGVAHAHLQLEPRCVCCGSRAELGQAVQVHHVFPFHCCVARGRPDPELDLDYVPEGTRPLDVDGRDPVAISNSFGFGGHNAVIVLKGASR